MGMEISLQHNHVLVTAMADLIESSLFKML